MKSGKQTASAKCEHCGDPMRRAKVDVYRKRGRRHVLFKNVSARVCRSCGERVFDADAVEAMEFQLNHPAKSKRTVDLHITSV